MTPLELTVRTHPVPLHTGRPVTSAKVFFAILTHDCLAYTKRCLDTLARTVPFAHEVFVVDNASSDTTLEWLRSGRAPNVHAFSSPVNLGVAGGRNALLDLVTPHLPDDGFVVFLDNDLEFTPGWTEPFVAMFEAFPEAGVAGVVGHEILVGAEARELLPSPLETRPVDVVSGGFACWVRARAAVDIGAFDVRTGSFWHEDDDYCIRALAAGWEVFAVPEARVIHHEHQSGVALPGLDAGGSPENQRYLVAKWRDAGWVDAAGWVIHPGERFYLSPEKRAAMVAEVGRPVERAELGRALWDLDRLRSAPDPAAEIEARPVALSPVLRALLAHRPDARCERALAEQSNGARLRRRLGPELEVREAGASPALNKLCDAEDWEDDAWLATARSVMGTVQHRDFTARHRSVWETTQIAVGLERLGMLRGDATALSVGAGVESMMWWLPERVRMLVATDLYDPHAERGYGVPQNLPKDPARHAPRPFASDRLRVLPMDARLLEFPDATFDFAYSIAGLHDFGGPQDGAKALFEMARVVKPGGVVAVSTDVVVDGRQAERAFAPSELAGELFEGTGLELIEPLDTRLAATTLEGWAPGDAEVRPHFATRAGNAVVTSAVIFLRRTTARPPTLSTPRAKAIRTVGIDARNLYYSNSISRGIGHYTVHHVEALARLRPDWHFLCYGDRRPCRGMRSVLALPNVEFRNLADRVQGEVDLLHVPDPMNMSRGFDAPLRVFSEPCTTVTFHDLIPLRCYWQSWPVEDRAAYLGRLEQLRGPCTVLTNSEYTREDLLRALRLPAERVHAVLAGLNRDAGAVEATPEEIARLSERLGIRHPFFLHVGAMDLHKNFAGVVRAFRIAAAAMPCQLVVAGPDDGNMRGFVQACEREGIDDVVFAGFVPRAELEALYAAATALVFLSFYEGFGFPALEAMARGCPVITSSSASLPEVVGDAGLLFHPEDEQGVAGAMLELVAKPELRADLSQRGRARAVQFTWEKTARRTLEVWEAMLADQLDARVPPDR